ncbi:MAG: TusE/DsrC/DsvC family sulfur relay protein [Calditrichia bacterium]
MATKTIAGKAVEVNDEGYLANWQDWTEEMAPELAKEEGINELTDRHWKVINYLREVYKDKGQIPTIRNIKKQGGVDTKELYELFPEGPIKKSAKIAGLPKPQSCV